MGLVVPSALVAAVSGARAGHVCPARRRRTGKFCRKFPTRTTENAQVADFAVLDGEPEVDDVPVAHDVVLAFQAQLPRLAAPGLAAQLNEVVEGHHLGADEPTLDVAVDAP